MELKAVLKKSECYSIQYNVQNEYGRQFETRFRKPDIVSQNPELERSMMEYELIRFHSKSKKELAIISNLSREVFLRQRRTEPELAKLVISIYLYFIDYLHYLSIEKRFLFPVIMDTVLKNSYLQSPNSNRKVEILETIRNIQREQYYAMGKLNSLRRLTGNYLIPAHACKCRKLLFSKIKKFDNALVKYIHFQYLRIFPMVMGG